MSAKIFIGNVSSRTRERDLERLCKKYGDLRSFSLNRNGFAFVEYEVLLTPLCFCICDLPPTTTLASTCQDEYDARDAIDSIDRKNLDGRELTCERARDKRASRGADFGTNVRGGKVRGGRQNCLRVICFVSNATTSFLIPTIHSSGGRNIRTNNLARTQGFCEKGRKS